MGVDSAQFNRWLLSGLAVLCLLTGLFGQTARFPYTVSGRVSQPNNTPAANAVVKLTDQAGMNREVYADDAGRYEIKELPRGRFYITAVNPAAPDQYSEPVAVELGYGSTFIVSANIFLSERSTRAASREKRGGVVSVEEAKQNVPKPARKAFEQAVKLRSEKDYEQSLNKFSRSIELFPTYFQALAERGHLLVTMGKMSEAMKDFEQALELNARYGPALRGSGMCKFQKAMYSEAIQDLERAAEVEPGNAANYYLIGIAEVALDRREQARASLHRALSLDPAASVRAHVHLATLLIRDKRPQEAALELDAYLQAVPNPPDGEKLRAILSQLRAKPKP